MDAVVYAQGKNMITCAAPAPHNTQGDRVAYGCVQPGTVTLVINHVELEFCEGCASRFGEFIG